MVFGLVLVAFIALNVVLVIFLFTRKQKHPPTPPKPADSSSGKYGLVVLVPFVGLWCAATIYMDFRTIETAVRQYKGAIMIPSRARLSNVPQRKNLTAKGQPMTSISNTSIRP